jgi:FtsP/CotA-like multicopper oxidase with cupredoxin domain
MCATWSKTVKSGLSTVSLVCRSNRCSVPLFSVRRGTAVSLDIDNDNNWPHAMHLHGHHFIYHATPDYWRDTALFARAEQGSMRFIADNPGKWLIHCHMVEHMAGGHGDLV